MKDFFVKTLNKSINAYINIDPNSIERLKKLENKSITLVILPFNMRFHFLIKNGLVEISDQESKHSDATIKATPLQLTSLMLEKNHKSGFFADEIEIEGDAEVGQQIMNLFEELAIDWQELVSHYIGDVPTYHLNRFAQNAKNWLKQTNENMAQDLTEYIHQELNLFPDKERLSDYYHAIDELRMDVDRVEAKLIALKAKLQRDSS